MDNYMKIMKEVVNLKNKLAKEINETGIDIMTVVQMEDKPSQQSVQMATLVVEGHGPTSHIIKNRYTAACEGIRETPVLERGNLSFDSGLDT